MIIPEMLRPYDEIRVISPSGSLSRLSDDNRKISESRFEKMNLKVTYSKNAFVTNQYSTSSIEERVEDIHTAFLNPNVKMIICAIGGYSANQIISELDYNLIKKNPKILIGYSDITILLNAITMKTGLVTYYGPNFTDFAVKLGFEYTLDYFKRLLIKNELIEIKPSIEYSDDQWYIKQDSRTFIKNDGHIVVNEGSAIGQIVGGNLCSLQLLQGTEYFPDLTDKILFLEEDDLVGNSYIFEFDRNLQSLMQQKNFNKIRGIVVGRNQLGTKISNEDFKKMLESKKELKSIPIIINVDFGHTKPQFTFPIGGYCKIDKDKIYISNTLKKFEKVN